MASLFRQVTSTVSFLVLSVIVLTPLGSGPCVSAQVGSPPSSAKELLRVNSALDGSNGQKQLAQSTEPQINTTEIVNRVNQELGIDLAATTVSWQRELDQLGTELGRPRLRYSELNEFRDRLQGVPFPG